MPGWCRRPPSRRFSPPRWSQSRQPNAPAGPRLLLRSAELPAFSCEAEACAFGSLPRRASAVRCPCPASRLTTLLAQSRGVTGSRATRSARPVGFDFLGRRLVSLSQPCLLRSESSYRQKDLLPSKLQAPPLPQACLQLRNVVLLAAGLLLGECASMGRLAGAAVSPGCTSASHLHGNAAGAGVLSGERRYSPLQGLQAEYSAKFGRAGRSSLTTRKWRS